MHKHLSMTTWKISGEPSAKSCRKNDANQHFASRFVFTMRQKPGDIEPARQINQTRSARDQDNTASQIASNSACVISCGRGDSGDWTKTLPLRFGRAANNPVAQTAIAAKASC